MHHLSAKGAGWALPVSSPAQKELACTKNVDQAVALSSTTVKEERVDGQKSRVASGVSVVQGCSGAAHAKEGAPTAGPLGASGAGAALPALRRE